MRKCDNCAGLGYTIQPNGAEYEAVHCTVCKGTGQLVRPGQQVIFSCIKLFAVLSLVLLGACAPSTEAQESEAPDAPVVWQQGERGEWHVEPHAPNVHIRVDCTLANVWCDDEGA